MNFENMTNEQKQWMPIARYCSYYGGWCDRVEYPDFVNPLDVDMLKAYYDESNGAGSWDVWNNLIELRREYPRAYITKHGMLCVPELNED